jgi:hypothetical protein
MGKLVGAAHRLSPGSLPSVSPRCPGIRTWRSTFLSSHTPSANQRPQAPSLNSSQSNALQSATGRHFRCRPGPDIRAWLEIRCERNDAMGIADVREGSAPGRCARRPKQSATVDIFYGSFFWGGLCDKPLIRQGTLELACIMLALAADRINPRPGFVRAGSGGLGGLS